MVHSLRTGQIRDLYDEDERIAACPPGMRREVDGPVVRLINEADKEARSFISYSALDEETADAAIARQRAYFQRLGRPVEWRLFDYDQPADLAQRLTAQGFAAGEEETILALELAAASPSLLVPPRADVRRLQDEAALAEVRMLLEAVWETEMPWFMPRMTRLLSEDATVVYGAYADGRLVSAAWLLLTPGSRFAGLYGGSTLPAYRGRGFYKALLAARAQEALALGRQFLTIDAGPMSQPIVQRLGFQVMAYGWEYNWSPRAA